GLENTPPPWLLLPLHLGRADLSDRLRSGRPKVGDVLPGWAGRQDRVAPFCSGGEGRDLLSYQQSCHADAGYGRPAHLRLFRLLWLALLRPGRQGTLEEAIAATGESVRQRHVAGASRRGAAAGLPGQRE